MAAKKLNFKFKAKTIATIERKMKSVEGRKISIEEILGDLTIDTLAIILMNGLLHDDDKVGCDEEKAFEIIDNYLEKNDKMELMMDIYEAMQKQGFLPKAIDLKAMRKEMSQAFNQN